MCSSRRTTEPVAICIRGGGWTALCGAALACFEYGAIVRLRLRPLDPDFLPRPLPPGGQPAWASLVARWLPQQEWVQFGGFPVDPWADRTIVDRDFQHQLRAVEGDWEIRECDRIWSWSEPADDYATFWNRAIEALADAGVGVEIGAGDMSPKEVRAAVGQGEQQLVILNPAGRWVRGVRRRVPWIPMAGIGQNAWWFSQHSDAGCVAILPDDLPVDVPVQWSASASWRPWGLVAGRGIRVWSPPGPLDLSPARWFTEIRRCVGGALSGRAKNWQPGGDCV